MKMVCSRVASCDIPGTIARLSSLLAVLGLAFVFATSAAAQSITVSGSVTDSETGEALAAANVYIEDTYRGTISNADGRYVIEVSAPATLIVRYIGYESAAVAITAEDASARR